MLLRVQPSGPPVLDSASWPSPAGQSGSCPSGQVSLDLLSPGQTPRRLQHCHLPHLGKCEKARAPLRFGIPQEDITLKKTQVQPRPGCTEPSPHPTCGSQTLERQQSQVRSILLG